MEGFEILGNATLVPIVIILTQIIKKRLGKKLSNQSDILSLTMSMILCLGWALYYITPENYSALAAGSSILKFKWGVDQVVAGFFTWFTAGKVYDVTHGNKKRKTEVSSQIEMHLNERVELQKEIVKLKSGIGADENESSKEDPIVNDKLLKILEG